MPGMSIQEGINQVYGGGGHVVVLGAGASIASTLRNAELSGKQLPSMDNFIEVVGLQDIVDQVPFELQSANFEALYSNLHSNDPNSDILRSMEMKLPNCPTIYDYLVLSLRSKDLIATFNWDPFLYQAWCRNLKFTKDLPYMAFLHGTVALGYSKEDNVAGPKGMYARPDGGYFEPIRLLYPVGQKDYNQDEFIIKEWDRVKYWLSKESSTVRATVFGYGAPVSDIEAIKLLNDSWGTPDDRSMEQFEVIDIVSEDLLRTRWDGFIHSHHYDISDSYFKSSLAANPRRTSESYFNHYKAMTIDEAFRANNSVPRNFATLQELWDWHRPLIEAEQKIANEKSQKD